MIKLNFEVLIPMYFEADYDELCEHADSLGMDSLTEDEQYFVNTYHRLDDFISQLSSTDMWELEFAMYNDNKDEIYRKYAYDEALFHMDKQVLGNEDNDKFNKLCGFPLDHDDY